MCVQCTNCINSGFTGLRRMTPKFIRNFACRKCDWNTVEAVEQEEMWCNVVETVREFT